MDQNEPGTPQQPPWPSLPGHSPSESPPVPPVPEPASAPASDSAAIWARGGQDGSDGDGGDAAGGDGDLGGGGDGDGGGGDGGGDGGGGGTGGAGGGAGEGEDGGEGFGGRGPGRRRHRPEKWSLRKKLLVFGSAALAVVIAVVVVSVGVAWHHLNGNIKTQDAQLKPSAMNGKQDILFIGSDSRAGADQKLGGGDVSGARSDTTMIFDSPADRRKGTEVSIPRDSMVQIPDCVGPGGQTLAGNFGMFNSAFTEGGAPCTVKTVENLTGITLTHYIAIDFEGVVGVVNALGGIKVCVTQPIADQDSGLKIPAGTSTLNGKQALAFVRLRHSIGDGSDLERIQRQQYFLDELELQVRSAGLLTDPIKLYKVLNAATQSITTDPGLGNVTDLYNLTETLNMIPPGKMTYVTVPNEQYPEDPNRVIWAEPDASNLWHGLVSEPNTVGATASGSGAALRALMPGYDSTPFSTSSEQALARLEDLMKLLLMADPPMASTGGDGARTGASGAAASGSPAAATSGAASPGAASPNPDGADSGTCSVS